ncbi:Chaperone protein FimC precursor [compost metagenome]
MLLLFCVAADAQAFLKIEGTRLIYSGKDREASIGVINQSQQDVLVQSWITNAYGIDHGDVPFAVVQPLVQLGSQERHLLRVLYSGQGLPDDRESMVWLNVMEIPRKSDQENGVQLAIRQRIKLFYRPSALQGSSSESVQQLNWKTRQGAKIEVGNPGAFHVSLVHLEVVSDKRKTLLSDYLFLRPGETRLIEAPSSILESGSQITFTEINDGGLQVQRKANFR